MWVGVWVGIEVEKGGGVGDNGGRGMGGERVVVRVGVRKGR